MGWRSEHEHLTVAAIRVVHVAAEPSVEGHVLVLHTYVAVFGREERFGRDTQAELQQVEGHGDEHIAQEHDVDTVGLVAHALEKDTKHVVHDVAAVERELFENEHVGLAHSGAVHLVVHTDHDAF